MNRILHEIINLKSRREILEAECGSKEINEFHLSREQHDQMEEDIRRHRNPEVMLEMVEETLHEDEEKLRRMH